MKKILITGSSSGIGKEIARMLLENGNTVLGLARNHQKFMPENSNYLPIYIDFANSQLLENSLKEIYLQHPDIDCLICCAGYGEFKELEQFSMQQIQNLMQVNFLSHALLVKTFLPSFKKRKAGKIIMLGSECALEGQKKGTIYCATKFAIRGFCQALRKECASSNISVSLINPGITQTPFFDALNFQPGDAVENAICPHQIAEVINLLIHSENNVVLEEINLQPLKKVVISRTT